MRWLSLVTLAGVLSGCSLLTRFDPETQPCDAEGLCLAGFVCRDGLCLAEDGGSGDDGGAGDDGGTGGGGGGGGQCAAFEQNCGDGLDDDCDSRTDCLDPDCSGRGCDDGDGCTVGETCQASACAGGQPKPCTSPGPCQSLAGASCSAVTGDCVYQPLGDGTLCGSTTSRRCCSGTCADISSEAAHCGGCGLRCPTGSTCESIAQATCSAGPANTSARCSCGGPNDACPGGQTCSPEARCSPASALQCAPGQRVELVAGCASYCAY